MSRADYLKYLQCRTSNFLSASLWCYEKSLGIRNEPKGRKNFTPSQNQSEWLVVLSMKKNKNLVQEEAKNSFRKLNVWLDIKHQPLSFAKLACTSVYVFRFDLLLCTLFEKYDPRKVGKSLTWPNEPILQRRSWSRCIFLEILTK